MTQILPVNYSGRRDKARFREVVLKNSGLFPRDGSVDRAPRLHCTFNAKTSPDSWTQATLVQVQCDCQQRSVDDGLNPTDYYLTLEATSSEGTGIGSGPTPDIDFVLEFHQSFDSAGRLYHLSFFAGMSGGWNWWNLYKLNLQDISKPIFEFVKTYCYCQGQVVDQAKH